MKKIIAVLIASLFTFTTVAVGAEKYFSDLQKNFNVAKGGKLTVSVSGGDIRVRPWDKPQVQMTVRNIGDDANKVQAWQQDNSVTVEYRAHGGWPESDRDLKFEFYVPRNFNLDLSTSGGDVVISGDLTGYARLSTSGGDLRIDNISGKIDGKSSGGDIIVNDVNAEANLSTAGGDIQVDRAGGDLNATTAGGEIKIIIASKDLDVSTAGGDIHIGNVGGDLQASTSSGDIVVGKVGGKVSVSTSGGDIALASGSGRITANTSGGDVNILNAVGSADVTSSGGTVKVGLTPKGSNESRIESCGGDVYLFIPSDAKATIRAEVSGGSEDQIISDFPLTSYRKSGDYGNGKAECVLNGGGAEIYLHTSSGNVYIKKFGSTAR